VRVDQWLWQRFIGNRDATLLAELCDQLSVAAVDTQWYLQPDVADCSDVWQSGLELLIRAGKAEDDSADPNHQCGEPIANGRWKIMSHAK